MSICQLMAKWCALSPGKLPRGGLPKNSVDRITDRPDMTSAVYRGRKEPTKTNKQALKKNSRPIGFLYIYRPINIILSAD